jgi:hypothetical protein
MKKNMLVALDGSQASEAVLLVALCAARCSRSILM